MCEQFFKFSTVEVMAEQDEHRYSTIVTEGHVCRCKGLSNCKNTSDSISRYHSDSEDSVFSHDESDDESIFRRSQTLTSRRKKNSDKSKEVGKKRKRFWTFRIKKRLPVRLRKNKDHGLPESNQVTGTNTCVCTGYRRTEDHVLGAGVVFNVQASRRYVNGIGSSRSSARSWSESSSQGTGCCLPGARIMGAAASPSVPEFDLMQIVPPPAHHSHTEHLNFVSFNPMDYPTEDIDDILIARRARDIELGIEVDSGGRGSPGLRNRSISPTRMGSMTTHAHYQPQRVGQWAAAGRPPAQEPMLLQQGTQTQLIALNTSFQNQCVITSFPPSSSSEDESSLDARSEYTALSPHTAYVPGRTVHTQVDYVHCLVPDLLQITNCSFYWGVMDRYEAEKLLENRPEGTFLLRDSAQEEFLFSVSFRRYGRSLHARIEQWKHRFSFDSHDPGVFASQNVCGLIEHYKDPSCCMFFEPMLTLPLNRTFPFSLQHLCRAVICSSTTYDGVSFIPLPKSLRQYLKYYHYKQKVRVRKFECSH